MPLVKIKALQRITDGGHLIQQGEVADVSIAYADEWIARGWAELVADKPAK
jgi:hypothetical protein